MQEVIPTQFVFFSLAGTPLPYSNAGKDANSYSDHRVSGAVSRVPRHSVLAIYKLCIWSRSILKLSDVEPELMDRSSQPFSESISSPPSQKPLPRTRTGPQTLTAMSLPWISQPSARLFSSRRAHRALPSIPARPYLSLRARPPKPTDPPRRSPRHRSAASAYSSAYQPATLRRR